MDALGKNSESPGMYQCNHSASFQQRHCGKYVNSSVCLAKLFTKCLIWYMLFELPWDVTFKHALELLRVTESVLHASTCMRVSGTFLWVTCRNIGHQIYFLSPCDTGHYWICSLFLPLFLCFPSSSFYSTKFLRNKWKGKITGETSIPQALFWWEQQSISLLAKLFFYQNYIWGVCRKHIFSGHQEGCAEEQRLFGVLGR